MPALELSASSIVRRPKMVPLPPANPVLAAGLHEHLQFGKSSRWDGRFMVYTIALVALLTLLVGALMSVGNVASVPEIPIPPMATDSVYPKHVIVNTPNAQLTGQLISVQPAAGIAEKPAYRASEQTSVDKPDRERLLSIISSY